MALRASKLKLGRVRRAQSPFAEATSLEVTGLMQDASTSQDLGAPTSTALTVVALGASAGGLDALKSFFAHVRPDPGVAYVVVTHLPAAHESYLDELLGRVAPLPVTQAQIGQPLQGGHVYVNVPGVRLGISGGRFTRDAVPERADTPVPTLIDHFMADLAEDAGENSVGIVLSGTAHDGTAGLKAIRAAGGLTLVQSPQTAQFPGMPGSAIAAGMADQVLAACDMPAALADYIRCAPQDHAPHRDGTGTAPPPAAEPGERAAEPAAEPADASLLTVLNLVQARTGHDFRWYRPAMLRRRLRRRMGLCRVGRLPDYIELLKGSGGEADRLKDEFLIGVTDFFRDPAAWAELEQRVIPELVAQRLQDDGPIRVWTAGCATGEESYSIAMLLLEQTEGKIDPHRIQVFATDIDRQALAVARTGAYPAAIASTVPAQRLARFFDRQNGSYVARKAMRDIIVFAPQDLVRDTPFSRLDLVLCRNLLIYFKPELQQHVLELFHFALKPGGLLLLGKAESIGAQTELFAPASKAVRLYRRIGTRAHLPRGIGRFARVQGGTSGGRAYGPHRASPQQSVAELVHAQLGGRTVTAAVLVDRDGRALYFHGDAAPVFQLQGTASLEVGSLLQPALRLRVRAMVRAALDEGTAGASEITLRSRGQWQRVKLEVEPVESMDASGMALALFIVSAAAEPASAQADSIPQGTDPAADRAQDAQEARQELAAALDDAERSNEELRTVNEEALALNEELQSSNEELESSKEELESLNEEVTSANAQLDENLRELGRRNDDLNNLLVNTGLATILVDASLRIRRFTPAASEVFHLKAGDEGRLLGDIASPVSDPDFAADMARATQAAAATQAEVRSGAGRIFLRRILPYRTQAGTVDGAVITYTDVTALRDADQRARELFAVLQDSNDAVIMQDREGRILAWNGGAQRIYGHAPKAILGTCLYDQLPGPAQGPARELIRRVMDTGEGASQEQHRLRKDGSVITVSVTLSPLRDAHGAVYAVLSTERDISHQVRTESEMYFRRLADRIPVLLRVEDELGSAQFVNEPCTTFTGRPREALLGDGWLQFVSPEDRERYLAEHAQALATRGRLETDLRMRRADGAYRWMRSISVPHHDAQGAFVGYIGLMLDVEDHKVAEAGLRDADRRKDDFLAMLAHELRNPLAPIRTAVAVITRAAAGNATAAWAVNVIDRQTELLAKLLDDLLDVARIARGKVSLERVPVELAVVVQRAVELCQPLIDARHHRLAVQLPAEALRVEGDLMRLTQVLSNLLTNAAKYMDEGGQIWLEVRREGESAVIRVRDTGMGMPAQLLNLVFDPFMQADASLDRSRGGLGLGLTLVKQLVVLHGGTVEAHSAGLGQGSEFIVRLPLLDTGPGVVQGRGTDAVAPQPPAVPGTGPAPAGGRRVLLVDDNRDAAESLALLLRLAGHEVSVAFDGRQALELAGRCMPQMVILDIGLPGLDGYQVARNLRGAQGTAHALMIALTGYGQPGDVARAKAAGFDHHFVKPVDPQAILDLAAGAPV